MKVMGLPKNLSRLVFQEESGVAKDGCLHLQTEKPLKTSSQCCYKSTLEKDADELPLPVTDKRAFRDAKLWNLIVITES